MNTGRKDWFEGNRVPVHAFDVETRMSDTALSSLVRLIIGLKGQIKDQSEVGTNALYIRNQDRRAIFRVCVPEPNVDTFKVVAQANKFQVHEPFRPSFPPKDEERKGDWMQLVSGKRFWPFDPQVGDFEVTDIAHCLAHLCRYAGHTRFFYSVAEHCVLLSHAVPKEHALTALLHDGSEAYCADIPKPIKQDLTDYKAVEDHIQRVMCEQFGIVYPFEQIIHIADRAILANEVRDCLTPCEVDWTTGMPLLPYYGTDRPLYIEGWLPTVAKQKFLDRYYEIMTEMGQ